MDKPSCWNSLRNAALGAAVIFGGLAGFTARYCVHARYTSHWRLQRYEASLQQSSPLGGKIVISPSAA